MKKQSMGHWSHNGCHFHGVDPVLSFFGRGNQGGCGRRSIKRKSIADTARENWYYKSIIRYLMGLNHFLKTFFNIHHAYCVSEIENCLFLREECIPERWWGGFLVPPRRNTKFLVFIHNVSFWSKNKKFSICPNTYCGRIPHIFNLKYYGNLSPLFFKFQIAPDTEAGGNPRPLSSDQSFFGYFCRFISGICSFCRNILSPRQISELNNRGTDQQYIGNDQKKGEKCT